jgi:hypothetical protein
MEEEGSDARRGEAAVVLRLGSQRRNVPKTDQEGETKEGCRDCGWNSSTRQCHKDPTPEGDTHIACRNDARSEASPKVGDPPFILIDFNLVDAPTRQPGSGGATTSQSVRKGKSGEGE